MGGCLGSSAGISITPLYFGRLGTNIENTRGEGLRGKKKKERCLPKLNNCKTICAYRSRIPKILKRGRVDQKLLPTGFILLDSRQKYFRLGVNAMADERGIN